MTSSLLPIIRENSDYDLDKILPDIRNNEITAKYFHICWEAYHIRGVTSFLIECDVQQFYLDLHRSGCAYLHYLNKVSHVSLQTTSFSSPFFDAITGENWQTVKSISLSSRHTHNSDEEYVDDFLYIYFLMKFFFMDADEVELDNILNEFELNMADDTSSRFKICCALKTSDTELFHVALCEMTEQYEETWKKKYEDGLVPEEKWAVEAFVFIEGVALMKLAKKIGMTLERSDYRLIPSLLLIDNLPSYSSTDWVEV